MGGKEIFHSLGPEIRAMALAGHYLQSFALMENAMNRAIGKAIGLDSTQETILCKNISFRDKVHILRTFVAIAPLGDGTRKSYDTTLVKAANCSADRNMVAHELFGPDESGKAIEFLVARAKGKLQYPRVVWTVDEAEEKSDELLRTRTQLDKIGTALGEADLIKSILSDPEHWTNENVSTLFQIGALSQEDLVPPKSLDSTRQKSNRAKPHRKLENPPE
jgi:hypothetical protein